MKSLLFAALLLFASERALAAVPDPTKSKCDPILIGNSSGQSQGNTFHATVRDVGNIPLAGKTVTIRFLTSPAKPYVTQNAGLTADCAAHTLSAISDGNGEADFNARLGGFDNSSAVEVRANGVLFGHVLVRSTDLDGDGATTLSDINAFRERFLHDAAAPETDYNHDGTTNIRDFALLRDEYVRNVRGTLCP